MAKYFTGSYIFTIVGLILAWFWEHFSNTGNELNALFIVIVLSVLEISLSFDNAVVNATKLEKMSPKWQHRFLTWGIFIAVFGMRFLFPLLVVAIFSKLNILKVVEIALNNPDLYAHYLHISHPSIITFGGSFLIMLFFHYFFNSEKKIHWIKPIEKKLSILGHIKGIEIVLTLLIIYVCQHFISVEYKYEALIAGIWGIITYLLIDGVSHALEKHNEKRLLEQENKTCSPKFSLLNTCFINFLYLELIDASFSLDGVLGAFALSKDILIITIGLSIGAMFVRSLTIMLVEKKTLKQYVYLEHGAHWAIGALALIMFISSFREVSEVITGFVGLFFIVISLASSILENKKTLVK